jgi:hypothetical protein
MGFELTMMLLDDNETTKNRRRHLLNRVDESKMNPSKQPGGCNSNSFATLVNPRLRAHSKQLLPMWGSAPPASSKRTIAAWPTYDAMNSAVAPPMAQAFKSAPARISS